MKLCVVIPIYNESRMIVSVVKELKAKQMDVCVIDDGSEDGSGALAREQGAEVLRHFRKEGKGKSLRDGFEYVLQHHYDGVITMDGDGQHAVADIDNFLQKAKEDAACVITGNRMGDYREMPIIRLWVNRLMSGIISLMCRQKIPDTQCGYRFIGRKVLEGIRLRASDYEIESEVLTQASRKGFRIYSIPVKTIYRNELSKIHPLIDTWRFFSFILKEIFAGKDTP